MVKGKNYWWTLLLIICSWAPTWAQTGTVKGKVIDAFNEPVREVRIRVLDTQISGTSDSDGRYELTVPAGKTYRIRFSHAGFTSSTLELYVGESRIYDETIKLLAREIDEVEILGQKDPTSISDETMLISPISMKEMQQMPVTAPSVEAFVKGMPGVASNNEFSSQYQVRGGNFDENLVYVNGIEIYRPFLTRSGQQEGLGFSNPSMAQNLKFSTGG
ncbi:MAG: carboxypeptidase regulatory-like domain-containing protein, partial [Bacteroidota bacterium]